MTEVGQLLARARAEKDWSLQAVADRLGVSRSAVNQWELGITQPDNDRIPEVLQVLSIDAAMYMAAIEHDSRNTAAKAQRPFDAERSHNARSDREGEPRVGRARRGRLSGDGSAYGPSRDGPDELPVYGAHEVGGGAMALTRKKVEDVERNPFVAEAFDVFVAGDVMSPAYDRGDRIRVFPGRPVVKDRDILLLAGPLETGPKAAIRRLVEITDSHWICKQWNPQKVAKFDRKEWPIAFRIVGVTRQ